VPVDGTAGKTITLTLPAGAALAGDVTIADSSFVTSATLADGKLVIKANAKAEDTATTVTLPIKSTNYNNYSLVVTVTAKNISYEVYIPGQGYVPATLELMLKIKENPVYGDSWNEILADNYDIYAFDPDGNPINGGMWFVIDGSDDYDKYPTKGEHSWALMFESEGLYPEQVVYSGTVTVAPKTLTAADLQYTGEAITKVYDGTKNLGPVSMDVKASALAGEDTELTLTGNAVFDSANTDATKVIFTPDALAADSNYALADGLTADIKATITKKETAISAVTVTDKTYDGTASAAITAITIPGVSGDLVKDTDFEVTAVFPDKNADDANVDVTVNVTLKGDAAKNYTLTNGKDYKLTEAAKINKATLTWKLAAVPGASYDYNGAADYNVYAVIGGAAAGEAPVIDVTYGGEADKPVDAGTYALAAALNEAWTENYALAAEAEDGSLTSFTINKARLPLYSYAAAASTAVEGSLTIGLDASNFGLSDDIEVTDMSWGSVDAGSTGAVVTKNPEVPGNFEVEVPANAEGAVLVYNIQFAINNANYEVPAVVLTLELTAGAVNEEVFTPTDLTSEEVQDAGASGVLGLILDKNLVEEEDQSNWHGVDYVDTATGNDLGATAPTVPGSYTVILKYHNAATNTVGTVTVPFTIAKQMPTGAPKYDSISAADKTLADANLSASEFSVPGTVIWVANDGMTPLPLSTVVKANTSYKWLFTPDDADKYENLAGSVVLYTVSMGGGGGGAAPAPKPPVKPEEPEVTPVDQIFTDVAATDWFASAVQYVYDKGMMNGTAADKFSPNATTTRGMIVTILWRLEGSPAVSGSSFSDVAAGEWYSDAVAWAAENKIVTGYTSGEFGAKDDITREQLATILFRYAQYKGLEALTLEENLIGYPDEAAISSYAIPALNWAVGQGLINGMGDGSLAPQGEATRAQVAAILMRYCEANDAE
ncbi:MAG: S-layer homology domain-containing protein, partial [Firmicutes bacterium]|nr:S-layer homology domain-containing protein [Bacillota bacterium]